MISHALVSRHQHKLLHSNIQDQYPNMQCDGKGLFYKRQNQLRHMDRNLLFFIDIDLQSQCMT